MSLRLAGDSPPEQLELQFGGMAWNGVSPRYLTKIHLSGKLPKPRGNLEFGAVVTDPRQLTLRL